MDVFEELQKRGYVQQIVRGRDKIFHQYPAKIIWMSKECIYIKRTSDNTSLTKIDISNISETIDEVTIRIDELFYNRLTLPVFYYAKPATTDEIDDLNTVTNVDRLKTAFYTLYNGTLSELRSLARSLEAIEQIKNRKEYPLLVESIREDVHKEMYIGKAFTFDPIDTIDEWLKLYEELKKCL